MSDHDAERPRKPGRCPICGRDGLPEFRPFCSKRCADIDLGRWLGERYAIPGEPGGDHGFSTGTGKASESDGDDSSG